MPSLVDEIVKSRRGQEEEMIPSAAVFPLASSRATTEPTAQRAESVFHLGHRRWLDGLRGVAILLVLGCHAGLLPGGFLGVDVFFVLSGFLITSLLVEEWQSTGIIRLKQFYLRRALRLLPAFVVLLVLCGLSIPLLPSVQERWARGREIAVAASYVSNWPMLHRTDMPILGHTWSLSVEEQFYVFWPALLYTMLRLRISRRLILSLVCCGIGASALLRLELYHWHQSHGTDKLMMLFRLYRGLDTRADALLAGCLLGLLAAWNLLPKSAGFVLWTGVASLLFLVYLSYLALYRDYYYPPYYLGLFTVVALLTAIVLARLLSAPARFATRILESAPLVGTGRISYALYLFHQPIIHALLPAGVSLGLTVSPYLARIIFLVLTISLSFFASLLSYYLIERPCLRLKERLRPRIAVSSLASRPAESPMSSGSTQAVA
jgi:peptidoglycan/LPS O-acetylase OafA/YrhL